MVVLVTGRLIGADQSVEQVRLRGLCELIERKGHRVLSYYKYVQDGDTRPFTVLLTLTLLLEHSQVLVVDSSPGQLPPECDILVRTARLAGIKVFAAALASGRWKFTAIEHS